MFDIKDFKGVIPANLTIFDKDENLDEAATREFVNWLLKFDIGGFYLTGSTGEGFLMTPEERKRVVEIVLEETNGRVPVVVHVGAISTKISIDLAKHAQDHGATGISSVPPFYWRFTENQIFDYYKDISESVDIPMIVYNVPLVGMMTVSMIERLSTIKNVAGVKYTGTSLYEVTQIKDACKDGFLVYGGCDEMATSNILLGVDGIIGSFYNVVPDMFVDIWKSVKEENDIEKANQLQRQAVAFIMDVVSYGSMTAVMKVLLRHGGINGGYSRRPFNNFDEDQEKAIVKRVLEVKEEYQINNTELLNKLAK